MVEHAPQIRDLSPPGVILAEALEERGMTGGDLARRLGCTEKHVSQLVNGRVPLTTDMALQLEQVLGIPAQLWNALEFNYQSEQKRKVIRVGYSAFASWMKRFPIAEMRKCRFLPQEVGSGVVDRVEALLQFFGVTSPDAWEQQWKFAKARFRTAKSFDPDHAALTAWLRRGEIEAQAIACQPYDETRFRSVLVDVRKLTVKPPEVFQRKAVELCASAGVALTCVPSLPKLALSGATRWFGAEKAAIHLSARYRSDDQFWFSFFHEACHVLEHKTSAIYLDAASDADGDPEEVRANEFSSDFLIPSKEYAAFLTDWDKSLREVGQFAEHIGVAPGIVVGRLQHDRRLQFTQGNQLKKRFQWDFEEDK